LTSSYALNAHFGLPWNKVDHLAVEAKVAGPGDDFLQSIGDVVAVYLGAITARAAFSLAGRSASLCCRI
jgi:hypothetical protein